MASTSTNGATHEDDSKTRSRVSQACSRCRTRKDRCDGGRPTCSACLSAGQTCIYESTTKKRGLPEGYVRGLEKLYALASRNVQGLEQALSELLSNDQVRKNWNTHTGDELHSEWKGSLILRDLDSLLSDVHNVSSGQKRKRQGEHNEEDDDEDAQSNGLEGLQLHYSVISSSCQDNVSVIKSFQEVKFPSNARHLLDQYFAFTHCWLPIVDRSQILRKFYEVSKNQKAISEEDVQRDGLLFVLCSILAYTSQHSQQGEKVQFDTVTSSKELALTNIVLQSLPISDRSCTIEHSQALLILCLLKIGFGEWMTAWTFVGTALRIILARKHSIRSQERNTLNAVLQGAIVLDVAVSVHLKAKTHASVIDLSTHKFLEEDGRDEWEPWCPLGSSSNSQEPSFSISTFNQLTRMFSTFAEGDWDMIGLAKNLYVRTKLEQLQRVTCPGISDIDTNNQQSPPHQVFFQLARLQCQLWLLNLPVDIETTLAQRAQLCYGVFNLLQTFSSSSQGAFRFLPPFLADSLNLVLEQARQAQSAFNLENGLPSYSEFVGSAIAYQRKLAQVWPVFSVNSAVTNPQSSLNSSRLETNSYQSPSSYPGSIQPMVGDFHFNRAPSIYDQPTTGFAEQSDLSLLQPLGPPQLTSSTSLNNWPTGHNPSFSGTTFRDDLHTSALLVNDHNSISPHPQRTHSNMTLFDQTQPRTAGIPVNSPSSYQGDEIDAIFREMAQLDANEWSTERAVGLKDFGFSDDLAFQAFCNDPERLTTPFNNNTSTPLTSDQQTWNFTNQPQ